jgi:hypothetical protein
MRHFLFIFISIVSIITLTNAKKIDGLEVIEIGKKLELASTNIQATNIYVIDLFSDAKIPRSTLVQVLNAIYAASVQEFTGQWNAYPIFTLFPRGSIPSTYPKFTYVAFLSDNLTDPSYMLGAAGQNYEIMSSEYEYDGPQPNLYVNPHIPNLPLGQTVIVVPYGTCANYSDETWGFCLFTKSVNGTNDYFFGPNLNVADALSIVLSHEVFESLAAIYSGFDYAGLAYVQTPVDTFSSTIMQVCDAVTWGLFNTWRVSGNPRLIVNFLFRAWFSTTPPQRVRFDLLGNTQGPLVPYGGESFSFVLNDTGCLNGQVNFSYPWDLNNPVIASFPILGNCGDQVKVGLPLGGFKLRKKLKEISFIGLTL